MGPPGVVLSLYGLSFRMSPILTVFRVQDHHGHAPQEHNPEKEGHIPEIIIGSGQRETLSTDRVGSEETQHRDADVVRSGFQDVGNLVAARELTSLGKGPWQGKIPNKKRNQLSRKK